RDARLIVGGHLGERIQVRGPRACCIHHEPSRLTFRTERDQLEAVGSRSAHEEQVLPESVRTADGAAQGRSRVRRTAQQYCSRASCTTDRDGGLVTACCYRAEPEQAYQRPPVIRSPGLERRAHGIVHAAELRLKSGAPE